MGICSGKENTFISNISASRRRKPISQNATNQFDYMHHDTFLSLTKSVLLATAGSNTNATKEMESVVTEFERVTTELEHLQNIHNHKINSQYVKTIPSYIKGSSIPLVAIYGYIRSVFIQHRIAQIIPMELIKIIYTFSLEHLLVHSNECKQLQSDYQYTFASVVIKHGGILTVNEWDPSTQIGGKLLIKSVGTHFINNGKILLNGKGYKGRTMFAGNGGGALKIECDIFQNNGQIEVNGEDAQRRSAGPGNGGS
eukprot:504674_1